MSIESDRPKHTAVEPNSVTEADRVHTEGERPYPDAEPTNSERQHADADSVTGEQQYADADSRTREHRYDDAELMKGDPTNTVDTEHGVGNGGQPMPGTPDAGKLREQWREVQTMFVDDPRDAVTRADDLVSGALQQLTDGYAQQLRDLETRWSRGDDTDTEALRQALRGYRDLFDQLLTTASAGGAAKNM